ncbi:MAG: hypothetical protein JSR48_13465 [Verrucomicrobia bacterium]|nr:hypothetical protein [Verrucomicrobiota bacterium]
MNLPLPAFFRLPARRMALGVLVALAWAGAARAQVVFFTTWSKTNNIYTNLNQEYPASGVGVPGSGIGTPNATFLFDPTIYATANAVPGSNYATNGVTFLIASDSSGRDFAEVNTGQSLVVPIGQGLTSVHLLMAAYNGTSVNLTLTGADSSTETFSNVNLPDFNGGGVQNQSAAVNGSSFTNFFEQTVFQVVNVGAGGTGNSSNGAFNTYNLVEVSLILGPTLSSQSLTSITLNSNGYMTLLLGVSGLPTAVPEPAPLALLLLGLPSVLHRLRCRNRAG